MKAPGYEGLQHPLCRRGSQAKYPRAGHTGLVYQIRRVHSLSRWGSSGVSQTRMAQRWRQPCGPMLVPLTDLRD
jgi:hypothetical protein